MSIKDLTKNNTNTSFITYTLGRKIKLFTDHKALTHLLHTTHTIPKLNRWILILLSYSIDLYHKPGVDNIMADPFSQNPRNSVFNLKWHCTR